MAHLTDSRLTGAYTLSRVVKSAQYHGLMVSALGSYDGYWQGRVHVCDGQWY